MLPGWNRLKSADIAIDLGTSKVGVYIKGEGLVVQQPPAITWRTERSGSKTVIGIGDYANAVYGKEPIDVETVRPMRGGVIEQLEAAKSFFSELVRTEKIKRGFAKPTVLVGAPYAISNIERRAVWDAVTPFNARAVHIVEEPLAAAVGSEIDISEVTGNMLIDIGYGITEVAVISLGGIVSCSSERVGGYDIAQAIKSHLRRHHNLIVGDQTVDKIHTALCMNPNSEEDDVKIKGKHAKTGLPFSCRVSLHELNRTVIPPIGTIINLVRSAFETIPAMIAGDLVDKGVVLSGGVALTQGLAQRLEDAIGVPVRLADGPRDSVLRGLGKMLDEAKTLNSL